MAERTEDMTRESRTPNGGFDKDDFLDGMIQRGRFSYLLEFSKHFFVLWHRGVVDFHVNFNTWYKMQFIFCWPPRFYAYLNSPYRREIYDLGRRLKVIRHRYIPSSREWKCLTSIG